ncbi:MAG: polysaccharide export protein [Pseudomonadota bacterium]
MKMLIQLKHFGIRLALASFTLCVAGCMHGDAFIQPAEPTAGLYGTPQTIGVQLNNGQAEDGTCSIPALDPQPRLMATAHGFRQPLFNTLPLSPGDLVEFRIAGDEDFSGNYVLDHAAALTLPHAGRITLFGLSPNDAAEHLERVLVAAEILHPGMNQLSLRILKLAPIQVAVSGAVFEPGQVSINSPSAESLLEERIQAIGDYTRLRSVSEALRAASGIRPDADLRQVIVVRQGWQYHLDLSGILSGSPSQDMPLMAGDAVYVPSTNCFQPHLVKPSLITPKGFRVFMSNLIIPATDNSSGAVGRYATNLPYGTRLLQAAISANCIGGVQTTNAPRSVVLASLNPLTGETEVLERSVEALLRAPHDAHTNPFLMPNDALACYDSAVSNIRDIARTLSDIVSPLKYL